MIRALIIDLDNTIYPVKSISDELFAPLFNLIDDYAAELGTGVAAQAKEEITRVPFQRVAGQFGFSDELIEKGVALLSGTSIDEPMHPYPDYKHLQSIDLDKFLVTTGFIKMQNSKVNMLGIRNDFRNIYIVDPATSTKTKTDMFEQIMQTYHYTPDEVLVIGDDPESEIKAAKPLGIKTVLYDPDGKYPFGAVDHHIKNHREVSQLILV
jgi:putative hydrolase of the HAD superfamily